jgi:hypothetical protein
MKKIILAIWVLISNASAANGIYPIQLAKFHYLGQPHSITYNVQCLSDESAASYTQIFNKEGYLISEGANNRFESKKFHSLAADTDVTIEYFSGNIKKFRSERFDEFGNETYITYDVLNFDTDQKAAYAKTTHQYVARNGKGMDPSAPLFYKKPKGMGQLADSVDAWSKSKKEMTHQYQYKGNLLIDNSSIKDMYGRNLKFRKVYEYNDDGRHLSTISEHPTTKVLSIDIENIYENGKLSKVNKDEITIRDHEYNDLGQEKIRSVYSTLGILSMKYAFKYERVDRCGNWVQRSVQVTDPTIDFNHSAESTNVLSGTTAQTKSKILCPELRTTRRIEYYSQCE